MSDESRLAQLHFLRRYLLQELARVDGWIAREEERAADMARRTPPPVPDWVIAHVRSGKGPVPQAVHVGGCGMAPGQLKAISREQALRALSEGAPACEFCRPDSELGVLD